MGSLYTALASFLDARHHLGSWQVRIDDIDPPRAVAGSIERILAGLQAHGLLWDGEVVYQSKSADAFERALAQLWQLGRLFRCRCTRADLMRTGTCGQACASQQHADDAPHSLRVSVDRSLVTDFEDTFLGPQDITVEALPQDFIVKRRDGLFAYQLAAAIDDAQPHFTHIVRGKDLLDSTHRQRWLHCVLGLSSPVYGHVPLLYDTDGNKLSKQNGAPEVNLHHAADNLRHCLMQLHQAPPPRSARNPQAIIEHAIANWAPPQRTAQYR
jgi:glutamyl-Q tRNA(Asp) synthetase